MKHPILLITPPFTQLNTPYPATAYITGFLQTKGLEVYQADLGIEVILEVFSNKGLQKIFQFLESDEVDIELSTEAYRLYARQKQYLRTIDPVIRFLQYQDPTLAHNICSRNYLPEGKRFNSLKAEDVEWAFGSIGIQDRARHLATLYLEDLSDFIKEAIDPHFGFSRYAERLGRTATHFDPIAQALQQPETLISQSLLNSLKAHIEQCQPQVVCISVPFPGNLFGALKCGQFIKKNYPHISVALGGGFANTELRSLAEPRFFDYVDYVTLDDGEMPLTCLLEHLAGDREATKLKRTFARIEGKVRYLNGAKERDVAQREVGTPSYEGLPLKKYLSVIEVANPMHRLWSDGRWNKLTLAHGCYWGKCSFCDVSLDYIQRYEPVTASILCDRMETMIAETGERGFHFVDEAAPPALMRDLAIEIIRRQLTVTWWTNIRFEKSFTPDLCRLLKASGCIAVSGGLEVASDRLLTLMKKGVTVAQVARVADAFTQADIMVHAYLMYGFPTQTPQETIDSLEMVRQLFATGVLQSGFWHQFAMTAHSPVGIDPAAYKVKTIGPKFGGFADNDRYHEDPEGGNHERFSEGLRTSLFNYMHGLGFDTPLAEWFEFKTPATSIEHQYIAQVISEEEEGNMRPNAQIIWLGEMPEMQVEELVTPEGEPFHASVWTFYDKPESPECLLSLPIGNFFESIWPSLIPNEGLPVTLKVLQEQWEAANLDTTFEEWANNPEGTWGRLRELGLVVV